MALTGALKDRARVIRTESTTRKVEGKTVLARDITLPWFKARLSPTGGQRSRDSDGTWKVVKTPTLLFGVRDLEGGTLNDEDGCIVRAKDRIEVDSRELGRSTWEIVTAPQALRKKHRVLGYEATLRRLDLEEFEERQA